MFKFLIPAAALVGFAACTAEQSATIQSWIDATGPAQCVAYANVKEVAGKYDVLVDAILKELNVVVCPSEDVTAKIVVEGNKASVEEVK
jgi:hypothetical protein